MGVRSNTGSQAPVLERSNVTKPTLDKASLTAVFKRGFFILTEYLCNNKEQQTNGIIF